MKTTVINLRTYRGPRDYVLIDRKTVYGNPFPITRTRSRAQSIRTFEKYFERRIKESEFRVDVTRLRGKKLACWCEPLACHGDVYVRWLERDNLERKATDDDLQDNRQEVPNRREGARPVPGQDEPQHE